MKKKKDEDLIRCIECGSRKMLVEEYTKTRMKTLPKNANVIGFDIACAECKTWITTFEVPMGQYKK